MIKPEEVFYRLVEIFMNENTPEHVKPHTANLILRTKWYYRFFNGFNATQVLNKALEYNKIFEKKREEFNKLQQKRRHDKRCDFSLTYEEWEECKAYFDHKCAYCGEDKKLTYDHFIPFSNGGSFKVDNIIPACSTCNSSKSNKSFEQWFKSKKFYCADRESRIKKYMKLVNDYEKREEISVG